MFYLILENVFVRPFFVFGKIVDNIAYLLDENSSPWARALALVREECSDFGAAFFDAVGFDGFFEGYVCLTVPDGFRETWLNSHYGDLLRRTFASIYGSDFVDYKVRVLGTSSAESAPENAARLSKEVERRIRSSMAQASALQKDRKQKEELNLYEKYTFDNFVEGECNLTALKACQTIVEHPGDSAMNLLLVYGAPGLGKTHLLQSIAASLQQSRPGLRIVYRQAYDFLRDFTAIGRAAKAKEWDRVNQLKQDFSDRYEHCDVLLMDDIQLLKSGLKCQARLSMLIRYMSRMGRQVVLSSDCPPSKFKKLSQGEQPEKNSPSHELTADLLNPLENCVAVGIAEPDFETRMALIRKMSEGIPFVEADREEICRYLAIQPRANVRVIEGLMNWLRAMHVLNNVELNLSNVKRMHAASKSGEVSILTVENIIEAVAAEFSLEPRVLSSKRQDAGVSVPRKVAMYLCRELTTESLKNIGDAFHRDYSTVISSFNSLVDQLAKDEVLRRRVDDIRYVLES